MPIVTLKDEQNKQTSVGRFGGAASADDFGASATRRGAAAIQGGLNSAVEAAIKIDDTIAEADALEMDNELSRFVRDQLYGGESALIENGYTNAQGRSALENRERIEQAIDQRRREIENRASGNRSRQMFQRAAQSRVEDALNTIGRHYGNQAEVFRRTQSEARVAQEHANAVAGYRDPELVSASINTMIAELDRQYADLSPEARTMAIRERASAAWADVIERTADTDPVAAQAMFEQRRGGMMPGDVSRVMERMGARVLQERARQTTEQLWAQSGGSFSRFVELARDIDDTQLMDEVLQRGENMGRQQENAEMLDVENARERALSAIEAGGIGAETAADRALLVRENLWNPILSSYRERASAGGNATGSEAVADALHVLSIESPQGFDLAMRIARGARVPANVTPEQIERATGYTVDQLRTLRTSMNSDDWRRVLEIQNGQAQVENEAVNRAYEAVLAVARPRAIALGEQLQGDNNARRSAQFNQFIMTEARAWAQLHPNQQPTAGDIEAITNRALLRGRGMLGGRAQAGPRAYEWNEGDRRRVMWEDMSPTEREVQTEAWYESQLHGAPRTAWERIPEAEQRAGVEAWRRTHPNQEPSEDELRSWIERRYTWRQRNPGRQVRGAEIREWGERRSAEALSRY